MNTTKSTGLKIIKRNVSDLHLDPANARTHPERNIEAIKGSLARFGQQTPIVIGSDGVVRKGNGTLAAARALGWETIDCVVSDLSGSELTAYAVADNRTAELAEWDDDVLAATLAALRDEDEALLAAAGFDDAELDALIAAGEPEPLDTSETLGNVTYHVQVECDSEAMQADVLTRLESEGLKCRALML